MSEGQETDASSVFDLELQLQEKLAELQWKSKALGDAQRELSQAREALISKDLELAEKNRAIQDLRVQLATANQVIEWIEKEKSRLASERVQLQINCDAALKERESLLEQAHAARMENMTLSLSAKTLGEAAAAHERAKKSLEAALAETQERFFRVHGTLQSNVTKLEREHQLLLKSVESTTQLNKRLQTVGLCTHAIFAKKNDEIKELQNELTLKEHAAARQQQPQLSFNGFVETPRKNKSDAKVSGTKMLLEQIRMDIEKSNEVDIEMEAMLTEFENVYPNSFSTQ